MIYLMNSAVMPAGCFGRYEYRPATVDDLRAVVTGAHGEWRSTLGYAQNAELVERWTGVRPEIARVEVEFRPGDRGLVMRLKRRIENPATKGAPVSADLRDWEFAWVNYIG